MQWMAVTGWKLSYERITVVLLFLQHHVCLQYVMLTLPKEKSTYQYYYLLYVLQVRCTLHSYIHCLLKLFSRQR